MPHQAQFPERIAVAEDPAQEEIVEVNQKSSLLRVHRTTCAISFANSGVTSSSASSSSTHDFAMDNSRAPSCACADPFRSRQRERQSRHARAQVRRYHRCLRSPRPRFHPPKPRSPGTSRYSILHFEWGSSTETGARPGTDRIREIRRREKAARFALARSATGFICGTRRSGRVGSHRPLPPQCGRGRRQSRYARARIAARNLRKSGGA